MEDRSLHQDEDKAIRVTFYVISVVTVAICIGLAVYLLS
jgi:hypothetical protein